MSLSYVACSVKMAIKMSRGMLYISLRASYHCLYQRQVTFELIYKVFGKIALKVTFANILKWHKYERDRTKVVSSNPAHGEVYSIQNYVIKFVRDLHDRLVVFSGYSGFLPQ